MTQEEAKNELQRRCNGLKNPNHILEVALQMQKEIYSTFKYHKSCDGCMYEDYDYKEMLNIFFNSNIVIPKGGTLQALIGGKYEDICTIADMSQYRIKSKEQITEYEYYIYYC